MEVETILDVGFEFALNVSIEMLKVELPFLRTPFISQITDYVIRKYMNKIYNPARNEAIYLQVKIVKEGQDEKYKDAVTEIQKLVKPEVSDAEKKAIREEIRKRARDLIRINI